MIHPTAIIDPSAIIGENVEIGPYSIIGADVEIGDESWIGPHVVLKGPTKIGKRNKIFQFASVGEDCQDKKYNGELTRLEMGDDNVVRECATIQRGTVQDQGLTKIGNRCLFMAYTHIAHDCVIGDEVTMANQASCAGHVKVGDFAILAGGVMVHQFCQIGRHCMIGINAVVVKDVPAFLTCMGSPARPYSINSEGLRRRDFTADDISALKKSYKLVYRGSLTVEEAIEQIGLQVDPIECVNQFIHSIESATRGIVR